MIELLKSQEMTQSSKDMTQRSFDENMKRLEEILSLLGDENLSPVEQLRLYQEANELKSFAEQQLKENREAIKKVADENNIILEDFDNQ